ncbi:MAG: hypothetical protein CL607_11950 [Anaerolineaceae bacterium]|nr:hypothetical protein [Anaerolineaceae bacterium]
MDCSLITYQSLLDDDCDLGEADVISFDISSSENEKKNRIEITADLFFLRVEYGNNVEIISELDPGK